MLREVARKPQRFVEELGLNERKSGKRTDFQRLSALIELDRVWSEYEENGSDWDRVKSGQPIYLDASCNGYQHVSALLRDEELAPLTTLLESKAGPQDLYAAVAESARKGGESKIRKFLKKLGLSKELIQLFIESVFSRSVAKQPTIVRVYGSTDILKCLEGRKGKGRADRSHPVPKFLARKRKRRRRRSPPNFKTHIMSGSLQRSSARRSLGVITRSMRRRLEEGVSQKLGRKNGVNSCRKRAG